MKRGILSAALFCALSVASSALAQAENPYLSQGKVFFQGLEYKKCVQRMDQAAKWKGVTPNQAAEAEMYAGLCEYNLGKRKVAETRFKRALALDPTVKLPPYTSPKVEEKWNAIAATLAPAPTPSTATASKLSEEPATPPSAETKLTETKAAETKLTETKPSEPESIADAVARARKPVVKDAPKRTALQPGEDDDDDDEAAEQKTPEAVSSAQESVELPSVGPPVGVAIGLGGSALAATASAVYFGFSAKGLETQARAAPFDSDAVRLANDARGQATAANVSIAAAGALATSAIITYLMSP